MAVVNVSRGKIVKRTWKWKGQKRVAYLFDLMVDGKRVRKQYASKPEAQAELDKFREEARNPKPVIESKPTLTLGEALTRFLELKARKRTARQYRGTAEHLKTTFGAATPLAEITASRISEYKAQRLGAVRKIGEGESATERRLSAAAVNRPLALLRHLFRLAHEEWEVLAEVPRVRLEKEPQGRLRWLTPEDAQRLLDECRKSRNKALADLMEFAVFTGMRQGEILGLTWDAVDRARGVVRLEVTKSGQRREVPLGANADAVLARRWTANAKGCVFGSRSWNRFRSAWETAVEHAKLDDFRFHDLRHTFASWLVQRGRTLKEIQDALGHRTITMTMRYSHLAPEHLRTAVAALDNVLPAKPTAEAPPTAQERHMSEEPADALAGSPEDVL